MVMKEFRGNVCKGQPGSTGINTEYFEGVGKTLYESEKLLFLHCNYGHSC